MYRLTLFIFLFFFLAACTKIVEVPVPVTTPDSAEDPIFSTLDFATTLDDEGNGLAMNGNDLYVVGSTYGSLDSTNKGSRDGILRRYKGLKLWGKQFGTRDFDFPREVATDSNGDVYVLGDTSGPFGFQVGTSDSFLANSIKMERSYGVSSLGLKVLMNLLELFLIN